LFRNCRIIGRRFRLAHVFFGDKIIETATFRASPREDDGDGDADLLIRRDNVFGTETEDARRRDFTINGLFYDVEKDEVIDHVDGLADLRQALVPDDRRPGRALSGRPDPHAARDQVRRAARLPDRAGYLPRAACAGGDELRKAAPPRVLEEVYRLVRGGAAHRSMELLVETGFLPLLVTPAGRAVPGDGSPRLRLPADDEAPPANGGSPSPRSTTRAPATTMDYDLPAHDDAPVDTTELAASLLTDDDEPVRELDAEELAWRRVWLDAGPPAPGPPRQRGHRRAGRAVTPGRSGAGAAAGRGLAGAATPSTPRSRRDRPVQRGWRWPRCCCPFVLRPARDGCKPAECAAGR
jgi:hypothetical protein